MRVSKATKRASETSEQTLHRQLISGTTHAQFAEGLHFSARFTVIVSEVAQFERELARKADHHACAAVLEWHRVYHHVA